MEDLQKIPGVHIPADLNREIRDQFAPHIREYMSFHRMSPMKDRSPVVDMGTFMDNYEE